LQFRLGVADFANGAGEPNQVDHQERAQTYPPQQPEEALPDRDWPAEGPSKDIHHIFPDNATPRSGQFVLKYHAGYRDRWLWQW
jgi:hypothetical protein